jgi:dihydrodipicolinate synthase/N-acetylneuraminate lyase
MLPETVLELAKTKNIVAVKEASGKLGTSNENYQQGSKGLWVIFGRRRAKLTDNGCGAIGTISETAMRSENDEKI